AAQMHERDRRRRSELDSQHIAAVAEASEELPHDLLRRDVSGLGWERDARSRAERLTAGERPRPTRSDWIAGVRRPLRRRRWQISPHPNRAVDDQSTVSAAADRDRRD